jgi:hypothetical protein
MKTLLATTAFLLSVSSAAFGQSQRFQFRGFKIGDPAPPPTAMQQCGEGAFPGDRVCLYEHQVINEADVAIRYNFLDDRLYQVVLTFAPEEFDQLVSALQAFYGPPASVRPSTFRTRGGTATPNSTVSWRFRDGTFSLVRYATSLTEGGGIFIADAFSKVVTARRQAQTRRNAARDLGAPGDEVDKPTPSTEAADKSAPVNADQPFFEFQVEKQAMLMPSSPPVSFPPALRGSSTTAGEVLAQFVVSSKGLVTPGTFKVLKATNDAFTAAVREQLPMMRFYPAETGGRAVPQLVQMPFIFRAP